MPLTILEQLETQEERSSLTNMFDLAHAHSAGHTLDDANMPVDDLLNISRENNLEDKEDIDALDSTEANLYADDADLTETDEGSELGNALSLYLREIGRVSRLTAQEERDVGQEFMCFGIVWIEL